jgi:hypothetical protein
MNGKMQCFTSGEISLLFFIMECYAHAVGEKLLVVKVKLL